MSSMTLILVAIVILILVNGLFASMEIALVSVSNARLRRLEQEGRPGAKAALYLQGNMDKFFAVVQIGITFVATLSAAIGGDASVELFTPLLETAGIDPLSPGGRIASLIGVTVSISYVSLVIGELVPKSLARRYPGRVSTLFARFFKAFAVIMAPAVKILSGSTALILKIFRVPQSRKAAKITTEEFRIMARELVESRQMSEPIHDMLVQISRLAQTRAQDVMVPRPRIVSVAVESANDPDIRSKALAAYRKVPHTAFPVTDLKRENVLGVIQVRDVLRDDLPPRSLLRPVTFCSRGVTLDRLLATMQHNGTKMSVVVDEYGMTDGIITIQDILEEFVGDIFTETAGGNLPFLSLADTELEPVADGTISLHELQETLSIALPPSTDYSTLAGFLMHRLERIPVVGDTVDYGGRRFEVTEMVGNRIKAVKISVLGE
ncbi:MAG: hemolysin family protein [Desulfomonilaceae bacterium]|nr:hemolysin family protein [Desulfomonilaceae bacterium]